MTPTPGSLGQKLWRWTRTVVLVGFVIGISVLLTAATVGTGVPAIDEHADDIGDAVVDATNSTQGQPPPTVDAGTEAPVNQTEIEREIHRFINERRARHELSQLSYDPRLAEIGRYHSQDMARSGYFAHESPGGETPLDRYETFGYECRVPISDDRYATGAENIAMTWADKRVESSYGGIVDYDGNETKIARGVVRAWMNSSGHRENVLRPYWDSEGIGVAVNATARGVEVFATQNFC